MYRSIERSWALAQELNLSKHATARHIGITASSYDNWLDGNQKPRKSSLEKVERFIDKVEAGETFKPKPKHKPVQTPLRNIESHVRPMYRLIYKLEDRYGGNMRNADEGDPDLTLLREIANGLF